MIGLISLRAIRGRRHFSHRHYFYLRNNFSLFLQIWLFGHNESQFYFNIHRNMFFSFSAGEELYSTYFSSYVRWLMELPVIHMWLIDWLIERTNDWLIDWTNDWLIDWTNDWLIDWLIDLVSQWEWKESFLLTLLCPRGVLLKNEMMRLEHENRVHFLALVRHCTGLMAKEWKFVSFIFLYANRNCIFMSN